MLIELKETRRQYNWIRSIVRGLDSLSRCSRNSARQRVIAVTCAIALSRCRRGGRGPLKNDRPLISRYSIKNVKPPDRAGGDIGATSPRASPGKNSLSIVREPSTPRYFGPVNGIRRINQAPSLVQRSRRSVIRRVHYRDVNNSPFGCNRSPTITAAARARAHVCHLHVRSCFRKSSCPETARYER